MKKILIWDYKFPIENIGGPSGYLYNIKQEISKAGNNYDVYFLSDFLTSQTDCAIGETKRSNNFISRGLRCIKSKFNILYSWYNRCLPSDLADFDFNKFDVIHFHASLHLLQYSEVLKSFNGKIVLTSHSPQPACDEMLSTMVKSPLLRSIYRPLLIRQELKAWDIADYILFPVEEAVETYYVSKLMRLYHNLNPQKFIYCASSISEKHTYIESIDIRADLNIPPDAFVICFIGRHNKIKGYDQLKEFGARLIDKYDNIYIVVAGKELPLKGLKHHHWIELGWIGYGDQLIEQSDLFILPNQSTYFDLITLEVLRAGTPILMTRTGGNKYFENDAIRSEGMFYYDYGDFEEVDSAISKFLSMSPQEMNLLRQQNVNLFKKKYTTERFMERYISTMNNL